ncbi:MAG: transposase [Eggerthellaceae bacterium]|nr:transposase [Eggerthellaceae bacterium]
MARPLRPRSESDIYHVFTRGTGRQIIYEYDDDRRTFLSMLASSAVKTDAKLFAYCLMGNRYHLVVKCDFDALPTLCFELNRSYATYFNGIHGRTGHLFQGRHSRQPINDDSYLLASVRYIHRNPVEVCAKKASTSYNRV